MDGVMLWYVVMQMKGTAGLWSWWPYADRVKIDLVMHVSFSMMLACVAIWTACHSFMHAHDPTPNTVEVFVDICLLPAPVCCRLLESIRDSVQHVDYALTRELAFQEGVRHAQLTAAGSSSYSWVLSVAATAAVASASAMYVLMRRNAL
jgi:hypothetical protein